MRSMSWQAFAAGGNGMIFYSLYDLFRMNSTKKIIQNHLKKDLEMLLNLQIKYGNIKISSYL